MKENIPPDTGPTPPQGKQLPTSSKNRKPVGTFKTPANTRDVVQPPGGNHIPEISGYSQVNKPLLDEWEVKTNDIERSYFKSKVSLQSPHKDNTETRSNLKTQLKTAKEEAYKVISHYNQRLNHLAQQGRMNRQDSHQISKYITTDVRGKIDLLARFESELGPIKKNSNHRPMPEVLEEMHTTLKDIDASFIEAKNRIKEASGSDVGLRVSPDRK